MSANFVAGLRTGGAPVVVLGDGEGTINVRVQVAELWDVVRVQAPHGTSVAAVKRAAIEELVPGAYPEDYVVKFRGWEVLDEGATLSETQIVDGSIILLHIRRRQPVK